jgi:MinD superfamily P-loop ATPase containing an inserted ferredoxin domain
MEVFNMHFDGHDGWLDERLMRIDGWIKEGKIPSSSKVIPVGEALSGKEWVLPTQQVLDILRNARTVALAPCVCRTRYQRCDNPVEVCLFTNDAAERQVANGTARFVDLAEAKERLQLANKHGLVHLTFYRPDQYLYALCSCCECCCHDLQFMKHYQRPDLIAHADYVAEVDSDACIQCGTCVKRCVFGAQAGDGAAVVFHQEKCFGCGLCVTTCPVQAITMKLKKTADNEK